MLEGLTGATGAQGNTGATGSQGQKGDPRTKGDIGPTVPKGDTGPPGQKGDTGATGPAGPVETYVSAVGAYKGSVTTTTGGYRTGIILRRTYNNGFSENYALFDAGSYLVGNASNANGG